MDQTASWRLWQKIAFRFIAIYFFIYAFPFKILLSHNAVSEFLIQHTAKWIGLSPTLSDTANGGGDSLYRYVQVLTLIIVSLAGCIVWSVADNKRRSYNQAFYWLLVLVRYSLAFYMLVYGFAKVFNHQFVAPSILDIVVPYGRFTPMGLLWRFMGYSEGYRWFIGYSEVIAGLLLVPRRTTLLGAILSAIIMGNVFVLNLFYDVPVKLFSLHLLLMAILVTVPDIPRLWSFFISHKPVTSYAQVYIHEWHGPGKKKWLLKAPLLLIGLIGIMLMEQPDSSVSAISKLDGLYNVTTFVKNHDSIASCTLDECRWHLVGIKPTAVFIKAVGDSIARYKLIMDTSNNLLLDKKDATVGMFHYEQRDTNTIVLNGRLFGDSIFSVLKKKDVKQYPLVNHGFRWVNEYPDNQ